MNLLYVLMKVVLWWDNKGKYHLVGSVELYKFYLIIYDIIYYLKFFKWS